MKVLVATPRTQGARATDFFDGIEGELVWIPEPCERGRRLGASGARCARGFLGLATNEGTTTAMIKDVVPMDMRLHADALRPVFVKHVPEEIVWEPACELATIAASWPAGTILERNLDRFKQRPARSATPSRHSRPGSQP